MNHSLHRKDRVDAGDAAPRLRVVITSPRRVPDAAGKSARVLTEASGKFTGCSSSKGSRVRKSQASSWWSFARVRKHTSSKGSGLFLVVLRASSKGSLLGCPSRVSLARGSGPLVCPERPERNSLPRRSRGSGLLLFVRKEEKQRPGPFVDNKRST